MDCFSDFNGNSSLRGFQEVGSWALCFVIKIKPKYADTTECALRFSFILEMKGADEHFVSLRWLS